MDADPEAKSESESIPVWPDTDDEEQSSMNFATYRKNTEGSTLAGVSKKWICWSMGCRGGRLSSQLLKSKAVDVFFTKWLRPRMRCFYFIFFHYKGIHRIYYDLPQDMNKDSILVDLCHWVTTSTAAYWYCHDCFCPLETCAFNGPDNLKYMVYTIIY